MKIKNNFNNYFKAAPYVKFQIHEKYELFGMDAVIVCNIYGKPFPRFEWKTEKYQIKANPFKYTLYSNMLIVKRFDHSDVANYTCTGSNGIGTAVSTTISLKKAGLFKFNKLIKSLMKML